MPPFRALAVAAVLALCGGCSAAEQSVVPNHPQAASEVRVIEARLAANSKR